jgi:hypothetical protein
MFKGWSFFISLMLVLTFGMALAPRPCMGDGRGGACQMNACACVAACTCRGAHEAERQALAQSAGVCHEAEAESCCVVEPSLEAQACHGGNQPPHFSLASSPWDAALPAVLGSLGLTSYAPELSIWRSERLAGRAQAPPEKPPRHFS